MPPLKTSPDDLAGLPFPRVLMAIRKAAGLTQQDVAAALQVTQPYISELEKGRRLLPNEARVEEIAKILGLGAAQTRQLIAQWNRHRAAPEVAQLATKPQTSPSGRDALELLQPYPEAPSGIHPDDLPQSFPDPEAGERRSTGSARRIDIRQIRTLLERKRELVTRLKAIQAELAEVDEGIEVILIDQVEDADRDLQDDQA